MSETVLEILTHWREKIDSLYCSTTLSITTEVSGDAKSESKSAATSSSSSSSSSSSDKVCKGFTPIGHKLDRFYNNRVKTANNSISDTSKKANSTAQGAPAGPLTGVGAECDAALKAHLQEILRDNEILRNRVQELERELLQ